MLGNKRGFTLIEVLLVLIIIAILGAIVIVAINPGRQMAHDNNKQRMNDVEKILRAINDYKNANSGEDPEGVLDAEAIIGSGESQANICAALLPDFISSMPLDPTDLNSGFESCSNYHTGYLISKDSLTGSITISSPGAELGETISITK